VTTSQSARSGLFTTRVVELLGSMRFAVSLLVFICLASVIGTLVPQNQPPTVYVDLFGSFWVAVFDRFAIGRVYNSAWFLGVMAFLVTSTTLCLTRNTPKMLRAARSFCTLTMPLLTSSSTATGTSNVTPKAMNMVMTKLT